MAKRPLDEKGIPYQIKSKKEKRPSYRATAIKEAVGVDKIIPGRIDYEAQTLKAPLDQHEAAYQKRQAESQEQIRQNLTALMERMVESGRFTKNAKGEYVPTEPPTPKKAPQPPTLQEIADARGVPVEQLQREAVIKRWVTEQEMGAKGLGPEKPGERRNLEDIITKDPKNIEAVKAERKKIKEADQERFKNYLKRRRRKPKRVSDQERKFRESGLTAHGEYRLGSPEWLEVQKNLREARLVHSRRQLIKRFIRSVLRSQEPKSPEDLARMGINDAEITQIGIHSGLGHDYVEMMVSKYLPEVKESIGRSMKFPGANQKGKGKKGEGKKDETWVVFPEYDE